MVEITASTPMHAASRVRGSLTSARTISAPSCFRRSTFSGAELTRVIARTSSPRRARRRTISEPGTPVAPATRIMISSERKMGTQKMECDWKFGKSGAGFAAEVERLFPERAMKNGLFFLFVVAASGHGQNRRPEEMRRPVCTSALQLPQGFCATVFAEGLSGARHIVVASNGDVFV